MVHAKENFVETALHESVQFYRLPCSLQVGNEYGTANQVLTLQAQETGQEGVGGRERADIYVSTSGLFKNPAKQT